MSGELQTTTVIGDLDARQGSEWDAFVVGVDQSDVAQLYRWSRVRRFAGYRPIYVFVRVRDELVAGAQVLVRDVPVVGAIGYVPYGPVLGESNDHRSAACVAVSAALRRLVSDSKLRVLLVQPPWGADDASASLSDIGFREVDAGIAPAASLRIDLEPEVEELRALLNDRLRAWTRKWPDRGVTVRTGDSSDLPLLADLIAKSAAHQGYVPSSLEYLQRQYDELAPANVVLFVGEFEGEPVAVDMFTTSGGAIRDRLIGMDRDSGASNLSVPGAIKWNAMLWAKEEGMRWFDFGSLDADVARTMVGGGAPDSDQLSGSDRFKLSFGGEAYLLPTAVGISRPGALLAGYDLAEKFGAGRTALNAIRGRLRGVGQPG